MFIYFCLRLPHKSLAEVTRALREPARHPHTAEKTVGCYDCARGGDRGGNSRKWALSNCRRA